MMQYTNRNSNLVVKRAKEEAAESGSMQESVAERAQQKIDKLEHDRFIATLFSFLDEKEIELYCKKW